MNLLPNNCSCSTPTVSPKDWMTGGIKLLKKDWYIQYYFRDPSIKDQPKRGKFIVLKRMNKFKTLAERREATQFLLDNEVDLLMNWEYNPCTGHRVFHAAEVYEKGIDPDTPFTDALKMALSLLTVSTVYRADIRSAIKYIEIAADRTGMLRLQINQVTRKHIKIILDQQTHLKLTDVNGEEIERVWSEKRYNVYWKYLHRLFEELIECEACEHNPVKKIKKKATVTKLRPVFTKEERQQVINGHLKENYYNFYRFCQIFFHTGGRVSELLRVKVGNVDLVQQKYLTTIYKGKNRHEDWVTIKTIALPFWKELLNGANPAHYIIGKSKGPGNVKNSCIPGKTPIAAANIYRMWQRHVKDKLNVNVGIYSLKYNNLDEISALKGKKYAQSAAKHTSERTTEGYLHGEEERMHQELKDVNNEL